MASCITLGRGAAGVVDGLLMGVDGGSIWRLNAWSVGGFAPERQTPPPSIPHLTRGLPRPRPTAPPKNSGVGGGGGGARAPGARTGDQGVKAASGGTRGRSAGAK